MKQFTSLPLVEAWHKFNLVGPLGGTLKMHETVQSVLKIYIFFNLWFLLCWEGQSARLGLVVREDCIGATVVIWCFHSAQPCEYFGKKRKKFWRDTTLRTHTYPEIKVQRLNHKSANRQKRASSSCAKSSRVSGEDCLEGEIGQM